MSPHIDDPLFLGLDLSTQGLKAVLIDADGTLVHESSVNFDRDLPSYGTTNGAIRGPDPGEVTSPVRMWLDAYDLILERMRVAGVDFNRILGISGDGQVRMLFPQLLYSCSRYDSPATWFSVLVGRCGTTPRLPRCFAASRGAIGSGRLLSSPRSDLARFIHYPRMSRA